MPLSFSVPFLFPFFLLLKIYRLLQCSAPWTLSPNEKKTSPSSFFPQQAQRQWPGLFSGVCSPSPFPFSPYGI